jgi:putative transposase
VGGLDFGIKDNIADSDGNKYNWVFPESRRAKKLSKKLNKTRAAGKKSGKKKSKNSWKRQELLALEYEKIGNKKRDATNKFVSKLNKENDVIAVQDENLAGWKSSKRRGWGARVQHSIMGGIMSGIKRLPQTVIVDRYFASTRLCPRCGKKNKIPLEERWYECGCGYSGDRDTHAARNILAEGLRIRESTRGARGRKMPAEDGGLCQKPVRRLETSPAYETGSPSLYAWVAH